MTLQEALKITTLMEDEFKIIKKEDVEKMIAREEKLRCPDKKGLEARKTIRDALWKEENYMFKVFGAFCNVGKNGIGNYCETLLKECDTLENALEFAEVQRCAWDKVVIYGDNGEVVKEV